MALKFCICKISYLEKIFPFVSGLKFFIQPYERSNKWPSMTGGPRGSESQGYQDPHVHRV